MSIASESVRSIRREAPNGLIGSESSRGGAKGIQEYCLVDRPKWGTAIRLRRLGDCSSLSYDDRWDCAVIENRAHG